MNVLAIGAHGDDLEYFCGGTLARYAQNGDHVVMCVVTDGRGRPGGDPDQIAAIRKKEAQAAADLIGAELVWMAIPDGELVNNVQTRDKFVDVIRAATPDVILTHPTEDYHPDHTATSRLVLEASQTARTSNHPSKLPPIRKIVPIGFMDSELGIGFDPEDYVDISDVWDVKQAMLLSHVSQIMPVAAYDPNFVMPPIEENMFVYPARIMSQFRGLACGARYAEAFRWWRAAN